MSNERENTTMVPGEDGWKSEPTKTDNSVERPKIDNA